MTSGASVLGKATETAAKVTIKTMLNAAAKEGLADAGVKVIDNLLKDNPNGIMDGVVKDGLIGAARRKYYKQKQKNLKKNKVLLIKLGESQILRTNSNA